MRASVGWKWKAVASRHRTGCSTCKSSPQAAFVERGWAPPRNSMECAPKYLPNLVRMAHNCVPCSCKTTFPCLRRRFQTLWPLIKPLPKEYPSTLWTISVPNALGKPTNLQERKLLMADTPKYGAIAALREAQQ